MALPPACTHGIGPAPENWMSKEDNEKTKPPSCAGRLPARPKKIRWPAKHYAPEGFARSTPISRKPYSNPGQGHARPGRMRFRPGCARTGQMLNAERV